MEDRERDLRATMGDLLQARGAEEFWRRLYGDRNLSMVSEVSHAEADSLVQVLWFGETFHQEWLLALADRYLALRVSLKRKGRKEAVQAMTGSAEQKARSLLRLRGGQG